MEKELYITKKDKRLLKKLIGLAGSNCKILIYSDNELSKELNIPEKDIKSSIYSLLEHKLINDKPSINETHYIRIPAKTYFYFDQKKQKKKEMIKRWIFIVSSTTISGLIVVTCSYFIHNYLKEKNKKEPIPIKQPIKTQIKKIK